MKIINYYKKSCLIGTKETMTEIYIKYIIINMFLFSSSKLYEIAKYIKVRNTTNIKYVSSNYFVKFEYFISLFL